jgi:hypothetical protein
MQFVVPKYLMQQFMPQSTDGSHNTHITIKVNLGNKLSEMSVFEYSWKNLNLWQKLPLCRRSL